MTTTTKLEQLGLRQARQLVGMKAPRRMEFIAEGLPIIAASARSLMEASRRLDDFPREAEVLEGHAVEECAKALILIDIVRCPAKLVSSKCGPMMGWFYNHLARLIYAEVQTGNTYSASELQRYVDLYRPSHSLEGEISQYIIPNWELYKREATLYADVVGNEDDEPSWNSPATMADFRAGPGKFLLTDPRAYTVVDALEALGAFSLAGVKIIHDVWGKRDFGADPKAWEGAWDATYDMLTRLQKAGLFSVRAEDKHVTALDRYWQKPMYFADLSPIKVTLEDLKNLREAAFLNEMGY